MDNNQIIDDLIEYVALNYDIENSDIKTIINKLSSMHNKENLEISGNTITSRNKYFARTINIDKENNVLTCEEKGSKRERYVTKYFVTTLIYKVEDGTGLVFKSQTDRKSKSLKNGDNYIEERNNSLYEYYDEDKMIGTNVEKYYSRTLKDYYGKVLNFEDDLFKRQEYCLANGDFIQKSSHKDRIKYHYCRKNESQEKRVTAVQITEEDFNRLKEYKDDYNKLCADMAYQKVKYIV